MHTAQTFSDYDHSYGKSVYPKIAHPQIPSNPNPVKNQTTHHVEGNTSYIEVDDVPLNLSSTKTREIPPVLLGPAKFTLEKLLSTSALGSVPHLLAGLLALT
jgi:hypothetical protein